MFYYIKVDNGSSKKLHKSNFKDEVEGVKSMRKAVAQYDRQSSGFTTLCAVKDQVTESSYKVVQCIAKRWKPFDGEYIHEAFLSFPQEVIFNGLPKKDIISKTFLREL